MSKVAFAIPEFSYLELYKKIVMLESRDHDLYEKVETALKACNYCYAAFEEKTQLSFIILYWEDIEWVSEMDPMVDFFMNYVKSLSEYQYVVVNDDYNECEYKGEAEQLIYPETSIKLPEEIDSNLKS